MKKKTQTHIAKAKCKSCGEEIVSTGGGKFQKCGCGKSFIDQERHSALWVRLGGDAEFISQTCPQGCTQKGHEKNLQ